MGSADTSASREGLHGGRKDPEASVAAVSDLTQESKGDDDDDVTKDLDLFSTFPPLPDAEEEQEPFSVRAIVVGILLGCLVNASNVYLGFKTGFTFGANLIGAIFGYGIITLLIKIAPGVPLIGTKFGPQENCICQAAATGAGGMAGLFVAGLPAMYKLGLLSQDPISDFPRILCITMVCSFFGLFAAVPLRKFFIIKVARELNLVFPSSTATALAIRSMHAVGAGASGAVKKVIALGCSFAIAFVHVVAGQYAKGIVAEWHIFTWIYAGSGYTNGALDIESWGWYIHITPAFFGSGVLVGLNTALSWWSGTVVAWALIGPLLVHYGECVGSQTQKGKWAPLTSFNKMDNITDENFTPSPRYWMLWPGILVLLTYSMIEFILHSRIVWQGGLLLFRSMASMADASLKARGKKVSFLERHAARLDDDNSSLLKDFATPSQQVPPVVWISGTLVTVAVACLVCHLQFNMNAGLTILACLLGLIFAFLAVHGGGVTDTAPLSASSKASQLVYGGITKGHYSVPDAQRINLIAGCIASGCADVSYDLVCDFRTGFLLGTSPKQQFYAQACGALVAVFLAPGVFVLFMSAYPCLWSPAISKEEQLLCPFKAPSLVAWAAVAEAFTAPRIPIPRSCAIFSVVMAAVTAFQVVFKNYYLVGPREKYRKWLPNWMAIGVSWVLGVDSGYANAILFGSVAAWGWKKYFRKNFELYGFSIAAGLLAGEGIAGVFSALLTLLGVDGKRRGTRIGMPGQY